ncbi:hypothetical protein GOEFS_021_00070 [Gordonia effusa NBRC 100432]|uniref:ER-bound oxygenase mpaB/mpaB'/Rubber oxygenase catalytic domain-containing protein n=1 Tax=Gordonia effusa NBRC 100432 TaxID=1077974 RepID=H0QWH9_9ACTN|nr:oxygenase MpaB family protein [Gordonia effusa]GAB17180.1 hypothetical protein GOEFS_021_00070 [Gordonia effusa NBRC 100432]
MSAQLDHTTTRDIEPLSRYYRPGDTLRPIPPGKDAFADDWLHCRRFLFEPWFAVEQEVTPTEQTRLFDDHMWQGDELMDDVVDLFTRIGVERGRALFEQAVSSGIATVPAAPVELVRLFTCVEAVPDWYDAERANRGRDRMFAATLPATLLSAAFAVIDTTMNSDVSTATGATGRFRHDGNRRLRETALFFAEVLSADHPGPGTPAFAAAMHVRLMHAQVRRGLREAWGDDRFAEFGDPISNSALCGFFEAMLIFVLADHTLGRPVSSREADDAWHFLRYWSWLMGVCDELLPPSALDAMRNLDYLLARNGEASPWRIELVNSLVGTGEDRGEHDALVARGHYTRYGAAVFAATADVILGSELAAKMFAGTYWETAIDHRRDGRILRAITWPLTRFARLRDRVPGMSRFRRRRVNFAGVALALVIRAFRESPDVTDDGYRMHDHTPAAPSIER